MTDETKKSPSQKLRDALYVYWENCTTRKEPFETWYPRQIEKVVNRVLRGVDEKKINVII